MRSEALDDRLLEGADHHDVDHARDDARDVLDRLAAAELRVARHQRDDRAAELVHAGLERDARARRVLLEHHRERAVVQRPVRLVALEALLDPARALEQVLELVAAEILELQEMPYRHGCMTRDTLRRSARPAVACGGLLARNSAMSGTSMSIDELRVLARDR